MSIRPWGRRSKCWRTRVAMVGSGSLPVPKVLMAMEVGSATPMA